MLPVDSRHAKKLPFMDGVAIELAKRLPASSVSRAINPALARTSDGLNPAYADAHVEIAPSAVDIPD